MGGENHVYMTIKKKKRRRQEKKKGKEITKTCKEREGYENFGSSLTHLSLAVFVLMCSTRWTNWHALKRLVPFYLTGQMIM